MEEIIDLQHFLFNGDGQKDSLGFLVMDSTELLSYILSAICVIVGVLILWGDNDYVVPASGRSLRLPCSFLFWVLAAVFWAMAVVIDDDEENL